MSIDFKDMEYEDKLKLFLDPVDVATIVDRSKDDVELQDIIKRLIDGVVSETISRVVAESDYDKTMKQIQDVLDRRGWNYTSITKDEDGESIEYVYTVGITAIGGFEVKVINDLSLPVEEMERRTDAITNLLLDNKLNQANEDERNMLIKEAGDYDITEVGLTELANDGCSFIPIFFDTDSKDLSGHIVTLK